MCVFGPAPQAKADLDLTKLAAVQDVCIATLANPFMEHADDAI
jgi:hypothetical protein